MSKKNVNGCIEYRDEAGELHRDDGPAVICSNVKYWYTHGKLNRLDGPAVFYADGAMIWYMNGYQSPVSYQNYSMYMMGKWWEDRRF